MAAETVGLIASVATLSKVTKLAVDLRRIIQDAPPEIDCISRELIHLSSHTQLLRALQAHKQSSQSGLDESIKSAVTEGLTNAGQSLEQVTDSLTSLVPGTSKRARVRWVLLSRDHTRRLMEELRVVRDALNTTLLLSYRLDACPGTVTLQKSTDEMTCSQEQPAQLQRDPSKPSLGKMMTSLNDHVLQSELNHVKVPYLNDCMRLIISKFKSRQKSIYGFSLLLALPFSSALTIRLVTRRYLDGTYNFSLLQGSSIRLSNLVSRDCEFFVACERGDTSTMKSMIKARLASPYDTTADGLTPISLAIHSGNVEAVQILLDEGVDADALFGLRQTSPLSRAIWLRHVDIVRLLMSYGASSQHITGYGWSPLFYLWCQLHIVPSAGEFIEILAARPDFRLSHEKVFDISGFGVIHRAAIFGQASDVATLIKLGISPHTPQGPLEWNAIQNAVFYNRHDVFEILLPHFHDHDINATDIRGWTLLHISASEGNDTITRHLLKLGADWTILTKPTWSNVADSLHGGRWTPAEVAMGEGGAADGPRRRELFVRAVDEVKGVRIPDAEITVG